MILINRTFEVVTPESAQDGEIADSGFLAENEAVSFRELVELMERHPVLSCSRLSGSPFEWLSSHWDTDYRTGEESSESLHYSQQNPTRNEKYWRLAMIASGHIRLKRGRRE